MSSKKILPKATKSLNAYLDVLQFVDDVPSSLKCFNCLKIIKMPYQVSCGHRVCRNCIDPLLEKLQVDSNGTRRCSEDGDEIVEGSFFQDNSALKEILLLVVVCIRSEDGCKWQGLVMEFEEHLAICEYNRNGPCPFQPNGCDFVGAGSEIKKHLESDSTKHDTLVVINIYKLKESEDKNNDKVKRIRNDLSSLTNNLHASRKHLEELQQMTIKANKELEKPDWFDSYQERILKINEITFSEIKNNRASLDRHLNRVKELANEVKETSESGSFVDRTEAVSEKIRRLQETHKINNSTMKTIDLKSKLYQATTFNGQFIWKLDNLRNRFTEAVSGKVTELFTPPLHTSRHGYRFSAKVLLNGEKKDLQDGNRVPHIAFYIVLLQGDYDEILHFPFPYTIKVTLLNMGKQDDIVHYLVPDEKVHFQKPFRDMNPAIGFSKFCSHDSLYSKDFVKDDAIYIKIEVENEEGRR